MLDAKSTRSGDRTLLLRASYRFIDAIDEDLSLYDLHKTRHSVKLHIGRYRSIVRKDPLTGLGRVQVIKEDRLFTSAARAWCTQHMGDKCTYEKEDNNWNEWCNVFFFRTKELALEFVKDWDKRPMYPMVFVNPKVVYSTHNKPHKHEIIVNSTTALKHDSFTTEFRRWLKAFSDGWLDPPIVDGNRICVYDAKAATYIKLMWNA